MKKILILTLCILLAVFTVSCDIKDKATTPDVSTTPTEDKPLSENAAPSEELKFTTYQELTDKFIEYCEAGDLQGVYSLYYDDLLTKTYERLSDKLSKADFDASILAEMKSIYSFEKFEYGCAEMPAMSSPLSYVNQLIYYSGGAPLTIANNRVTNCVDLRVYKDSTAYPADHMLACIDGYWYFVV